MTTPPVRDQSQAVLTSDRSSEKSSHRFEGFDFLRAIFSIAIVALKTNLFALAEIFGSGALAYGLMSKIGYLAVPVFLQLSLFLFFLKSKQSGFSYFLQKRLPKLISLYLFWVGSKMLFDIFVNGQLATIQQRLSSVRGMIEFIVSGNQSPFFFFFTLMFLSTVAALLITLFRRLDKPQMNVAISYGLLFLSCLIVLSFSLADLIVSQSSGNGVPGFLRTLSSIARWDYNPISFLPYIFTAFLVVQELNDGKLKSWNFSLKLKVCSLLFLYVLFSVLEWNLFEKLLHYSRLSLIFGSWLLLYVGILSTQKVPGIVKFISSCSLGIYGFHVFFTRVPAVENIGFLNFLQAVPGLEILAGFLVTLLGSIALTLVSRRIRFVKNFV